ncbi:MAG: hypothetical protein AAF748_07860 [Pseudomonadota bacterium]
MGTGAKSIIRAPVLWLMAALCWVNVAPALYAHAENENYVWINVETDRLSGRFEIALADLEARLGIAIPDDPDALEASLDAALPVLQEYLSQRFAIEMRGQPVPFTLIDARPTGGAKDWFATFAFETGPLALSPQITLRNEIFMEEPRDLHRPLALVLYDRVRGQEYDEEFAVLVFGPEKPRQILDFEALEPIPDASGFTWIGILQVLGGADHLLFALALLLTAVWHTRNQCWVPIGGIPAILGNTALIGALAMIGIAAVFAATVLARIPHLGMVANAMSATAIIALALHNLRPVLGFARYGLVLLAGLAQGAALAQSFAAVQYRMVDWKWLLFDTVFGMALALLILAVLLLPLFAYLRARPIYTALFVNVGSVAIAAAALVWLFLNMLGVAG